MDFVLHFLGNPDSTKRCKALPGPEIVTQAAELIELTKMGSCCSYVRSV